MYPKYKKKVPIFSQIYFLGPCSVTLTCHNYPTAHCFGFQIQTTLHSTFDLDFAHRGQMLSGHLTNLESYIQEIFRTWRAELINPFLLNRRSSQCSIHACYTLDRRNMCVIQKHKIQNVTTNHCSREPHWSQSSEVFVGYLGNLSSKSQLGNLSSKRAKVQLKQCFI